MSLAFKVQQQVHSYRNGHSLAGASITLERGDQDLVDRLSDLAGPLGPGQTFSPYLTFYPLTTEPFYVVARTWQDLAAPRAGCVITRSLLVPQEVWRGGSILDRLLAELDSQGTGLSSVNEFDISQTSDSVLPTLEPGGTGEFVEAFFLEKRQPIVLFEATAPETFASRLIEGLWPAFRSSLAICTHANSPRTIQGRPFDILFAPSSARSNFSAWTGRRIDGRPGSRQPRHNWTSSIAERLFESPRVVPLTVSFGELDVSQDEADESQFRLAMLWDELRQRSRESPFAVLGMLDIVSSLGQSGVSISKALRPIIGQSVRLAEKLGTRSLLQFLMTLLGKFPSRLPPTTALSEIRRSVSNATAEAPEEALSFLRDQGEQNSSPPAVVMTGLADGLVKSKSVSDRTAELLSLSDEALLALLGYGPQFARELVNTIVRRESTEGFERLERLFSTADIKLRDRACRNIIPLLNQRIEEGLLTALLRGANERTLATSVRRLHASGGIEVPELGAVLVGAADSPSKLAQLRSMLSQLPESAGTDAVLVRTLTPDESDMEWVLSEQIETERASKLLRNWLQRSSDSELRRIPPHLADLVLERSGFENSEPTLDELNRILSLVPSTCDAMLSIALAKSDELVPTANVGFAQFLMTRVLTEGAAYGLAAEALERFGPRVPARELALMATASKVRPEQVSNNLMLFEGASFAVRSHVATRADVLTEQIVGRRTMLPSLDAINAWAKLISEASRQANDSASLRAASVALEFALQATRVQIGPLLRVAFPRVYAHLRSSEYTPSILSFFSFHDWDRCKTARKDLVRAFENSVWPVADLLIIADSVMEVESFWWILSKTSSGRDLLDQALADDTLPLHVRNAFLACRSRSG